MSHFMHLSVAPIGEAGLPDISVARDEWVNLDQVESLTEWVSAIPSVATVGDQAYLPYVLLVFASGREAALPLNRYAHRHAAFAVLDEFVRTIIATSHARTTEHQGDEVAQLGP